jgi:hypothetical protein
MVAKTELLPLDAVERPLAPPPPAPTAIVYVDVKFTNCVPVLNPPAPPPPLGSPLPPELPPPPATTKYSTDIVVNVLVMPDTVIHPANVAS